MPHIIGDNDSDIDEIRERRKRRRVALRVDPSRTTINTAQGVDAVDSSAAGAGTASTSLLVTSKAAATKGSDAAVEVTSKSFLKGQRTLNPQNDYCHHFVDTGQRPQNMCREYPYGDDRRLENIPSLHELIRLKDQLARSMALPPMYIQCDLSTYDLRNVGNRFDVILIDAPLEEYQRRAPDVIFDHRPWTFDQIGALRVDLLADIPSFLFMWVGSSDGLRHGRAVMQQWGYRRVEDICWVKTNKKSTTKDGVEGGLLDGCILRHTLEHCLMGIKGNPKRSTDTHLIHCNCDVDVIVSEEFAHGSTEKPAELYSLIEHFCLGRRRIELFGSPKTVRPGWVTMGNEFDGSHFDAKRFPDEIERTGGRQLRYSSRIDALRPKTPPPKN